MSVEGLRKKLNCKKRKYKSQISLLYSFKKRKWGIFYILNNMYTINNKKDLYLFFELLRDKNIQILNLKFLLVT